MHQGRTHSDRLSDGERERFEAAEAAEQQALRLLQLQAVLALVLLYFGLLFAYAVFA